MRSSDYFYIRNSVNIGTSLFSYNNKLEIDVDVVVVIVSAVLPNDVNSDDSGGGGGGFRVFDRPAVSTTQGFE